MLLRQKIVCFFRAASRRLRDVGHFFAAGDKRSLLLEDRRRSIEVRVPTEASAHIQERVC
jgi:hypothetical protein